MVSQGSRPLTISIRVGGNRERLQPSQSSLNAGNSHKPAQHPSYRQLPSSIIRTNYSRGINNYITKLKTKRKNILHDLSDIRDDMVTTFSMSPDPIRSDPQEMPIRLHAGGDAADGE